MTQALTFHDVCDRPIFIVSTPRSGSTLLFETLEKAPDLYSTGQESHWLIEDIAGLHPAERGWSSNRLTADDAATQVSQRLASAFFRQVRDRNGGRPAGPIRLLEKTPKNALRVPFFDALSPDSLFVYLYRDPRQTIASMIEAWRSGGFRTYPELPNWRGPPWSLLLVPGWERLNGLQLAEIVANQWAITTSILVEDLAKLPKGRVCSLSYDEFVTSPGSELSSLFAALDLRWDRPAPASLPLSKTTVTAPRPEKWRSIETTINAIWPIVADADARAREFAASRRPAVAAGA